MEITLTLILVAVIVLKFLIHIGKKYNKTDWGKSWLNILDGINCWFCRRYHRLPEQFLELPESGSAILVSNHISGLDPLLLIAATKRPLHFMIAQEEYDRWWLKWLLKGVGCIPVKRDKNPTKAMKHCMSALQQGEILVVFPQGGIVVEDNEKPLKKGAFVLAKMADVPLFGVRIEGVTGKGFTILAVFFRSQARIIESESVFQLNDENIKQTLSELKHFFFSRPQFKFL